MAINQDAVILVCSRQASRRLPGKAFKTIAGVPAIEHILRRCKKTGIYTVFLVPDGEIPSYDKLLAETPHSIFSGNPQSPLHRMADFLKVTATGGRTPAGNKWGPWSPEWIVRVTHDDILIDHYTVVDLLAKCKADGSGYGISPGIVDGAGVEVIHRDNILSAAERRKEPTEFVSYFVRGEGMPMPGITRMLPRRGICSPHRLTMDYHEDAQVLEIVMRAVGPDASLDEVVAWLDNHAWVAMMNKTPLISVYTCVQNGQRWLIPAIDSVLSNVFLAEYIFVDDYSTDDTLSLAAKFASDNRIKIIMNERNVGLASSSNIALSAARGKYVMRVDADDKLTAQLRDWLEMLKLLDDGANVVYPAYQEVDEEGNELNDGPSDPRDFHHVGGAIFDKKFLDELRFREGLRNWDGLELFQRMRAAGAKIAYYDKPTWNYRVRRDSMSRTNLADRERTRREVLGR